MSVQLKYCLAFIAIIDLTCAIKLGLIETDPKLIALCQKAIADAKSVQQCDQTVEIVNRTGCIEDSPALGTVNVAQMFFRESIQGAIIGRCDEESLELARLSYFWDLPIFVRVGTSSPLNDRNFYPTTIQIVDISVVTMSQALAQLMKKIGLSEMIIVSPKQETTENLPFAVSIKTYLATYGISVKDTVEVDESQWDNIYETSSRIRTTIKVIAIDAEFQNLLTVLSSLSVEDLSTNGYLIILLCQETLNVCSSGVLSKVPKANVVVLSPNHIDQQKRFDLIKQWVNDDGSSNILYADYLSIYNSCYGFCYGTTLTTPPNGKVFTTALKSKTFEGKLGPVTLDAGASVIQEFLFQRLQNGNWSTITTARVINADCTIQGCTAVSLDPQDFKIWESTLKMPITPCFYLGNCTSYLPLFIGLGVLAIAALFLICAYFYRRQKRLDMFRLHWKIPKAQLKVIENKASKSKAIPTGDESKASTLVSKRRVIQAYALFGTSKAEFMALKQLRKIRWMKPELKFISELKRINHDNCANFLGLCYNEGDRFYILHNLVERASLDNFIFDSDFNMDNTFKSAFLRDIINGLQYLHKSAVSYHGLLSCQNCLIDANWVLKLTNFGVVNLLNTAIEREQLKLMEIIPFNAYFTSSPENLQGIAYGRMFPNGTKLGDLYSFGMLLYHILFRRQPYESNNLTAKEVIDEVKNKGIKPDVSDALPEEKPLIDIMDQCWSRTPESRPKLRILNQVISSTFESSKGNLIDQMLNLNNRHAQQLERVVSERTEEFETQKRMNARLLRQLLPGSIADRLMAGENIQPRFYEAATVLFGQLVDFGRFLGQTAPHNVIKFLNDVFTRFDEVIGEHDAYKVETTGETYMVASGVPTENDNQHVFEIAEIALQLRDVCSGYKVEHMPGWKVQIRVGFHCGTLAAGVVGVKAPRFCLFGDTVNFASRMQSNCPPNQIQMSEPTAMMLMVNPRYKLTKRGIVKVKGKGDVNTYWLNEHLEDTPAKKEELSALPPVISSHIDSSLLSTIVNQPEKEDSAEIPPADPVHSTDETISEIEDIEKLLNEANDSISNAETVKLSSQ